MHRFRRKVKQMKVTVLGAGNGGVAAAWDWGIHGHEVALWSSPEYGDNLGPIAEKGGVTCLGSEAGFGEVAYAGSDIGKALKGAELVLAVGPAYSTEAYARAVKPHLSSDQLYVVCPSSCLGAVVFKNALGLELRAESPVIGETSTLPYGVRVTGPAEITMYNKLKGGVFVAALPSTGTEQLRAALAQVYPGVESGGSILQTSLQNGNPVIHPATTLLNASRIESPADFLFYEDGVTPASGGLIQAVDDERLAIAAKLGLRVLPDPEIGVLQGYMTEATYVDGYVTAPGFRGIVAQTALDHRYLVEDVGFGLVFLSDLARQIGVPTPVMDALITLASTILKRDFVAEQARTLDSVGLGQLTVDELRRL